MKSSHKFALAVLVWALFFPPLWLMAVSIAVVLHELSHMLLCKLLRIPILGLKALPWGLTVSAPIMYEPSSQLAVSLAGPMCNLFLLMLCPALRTFAGKEISDVFAIANLANGLLNLLPALPLDGGIALKSYLCSRFGFGRGFSIMLIITASLGCIFIILGIHILLLTGSNASYLMAGGFILWNLRHEKELLMCIRKRLLTGEISSRPATKVIRADARSNAICFIDRISPSYTLVVEVTLGTLPLGTVGQNTLISKVLKNSVITLEECIEKKENLC